MKVLVTGGAGFVGSHLVDRLVASGHAVTVLDNLDPQVHGPAARPLHIAGHVAKGAVRFLQGDINDDTVLAAALEGVDAVAHLAAAVGVGQSMYEPHYYVQANCGGTGRLLDRLAKQKGRVARLVVASSMSLYGEGAVRCPACGGETAAERSEAALVAGRWELPCAACGTACEPLPTPENKTAEIASVYAATKKHQEDLCLSFGRAHGLSTLALRLFNVYGPRQSLNNPYTGVAAIFLARLLNGRRPLVFEDGQQSRDFVEVHDVARAFQRALESPVAGCHVMNVGTGTRVTVAAVARVLAERLGLAIEPQLLGRHRAGDIRHCIADPSRAREVLGFTPGVSFEAGLVPLIAWCRGQHPEDGVDASIAVLRDKGLVR